MIGLEGRVVKPLNRVGLIQVHGELWKASSVDGTVVAADEAVIVVDMDGLRLLAQLPQLHE
jgi:membrane-bound ClpP family serine protease